MPAGWSVAQRTTGRHVVVELGDHTVSGIATGVDPETGALLMQDDSTGMMALDSGEVIRCRVR